MDDKWFHKTFPAVIVTSVLKRWKVPDEHCPNFITFKIIWKFNLVLLECRYFVVAYLDAHLAPALLVSRWKAIRRDAWALTIAWKATSQCVDDVYNTNVVKRVYIYIYKVYTEFSPPVSLTLRGYFYGNRIAAVETPV